MKILGCVCITRKRSTRPTSDDRFWGEEVNKSTFIIRELLNVQGNGLVYFKDIQALPISTWAKNDVNVSILLTNMILYLYYLKALILNSWSQ